jgi:nitrite reductase (NO-forming)
MCNPPWCLRAERRSSNSQVPGTYILVDHSLGRLKKGAIGFLEGPANPQILNSVTAGSLASGGH